MRRSFVYSLLRAYIGSISHITSLMQNAINDSIGVVEAIISFGSISLEAFNKYFEYNVIRYTSITNSMP